MSSFELDKRIVLLNTMLNTVNKPSIELHSHPLKNFDVGKTISMKGELIPKQKGSPVGKKSKMEFENISLPEMGVARESTRVIIVESGVAKEIYKKTYHLSFQHTLRG